MKLHLSLFFLLACLSAPLAAQTATPMPEWDKLTPQQRDTLIAPIRDRWNNAPEHRQRMYDRSHDWETMTPEQRQQARRGMNRFENMSPGQRRDAQALFGKMRHMDKAQRDQLNAQWQAMTPEQRKQWVDANPPPRDQDRRPR